MQIMISTKHRKGISMTANRQGVRTFIKNVIKLKEIHYPSAFFKILREVEGGQIQLPQLCYDLVEGNPFRILNHPDSQKCFSLSRCCRV